MFSPLWESVIRRSKWHWLGWNGDAFQHPRPCLNECGYKADPYSTVALHLERADLNGHPQIFIPSSLHKVLSLCGSHWTDLTPQNNVQVLWIDPCISMSLIRESLMSNGLGTGTLYESNGDNWCKSTDVLPWGKVLGSTAHSIPFARVAKVDEGNV